MPQVNPAILRWARETAGLDEDETAAKLGLREAYGVPAIERLRNLEAGKATPSRPLLVKMARHYRRPLLAFYLSAPPPRGDRGQDFRTLPMEHASKGEALLDALVREVQARQSLIRSAIHDDDETRDLDFIGSRSMNEGAELVLASLRAALSLSLEGYRNARDLAEAFKLLRAHAERAGVFVLLLGNLGSHHTNIDLETFRGFALADRVAPFIVINDQDHHAAWSFTLLHEFTHLLLGQTGISGENPSRAVERFCNDVASEYLLPSSELVQLGEISRLGTNEAASRIGDFARQRKLSYSMVSYRLYRTKVIDDVRWRDLRNQFRQRWLEDRDRRRSSAQSSEGGPDYYVVRRHRLGNALIETTARLMASGALTTSKAARVLGVKPKNVQNLVGKALL